MASAGDERVEVMRCRVAERRGAAARLLARGLSTWSVVDACMRDPLFDYVDDHLDPAAPLKQDERGKSASPLAAAFGRTRWRALCQACLEPVGPAAVGSRALEPQCRECGAPLEQRGATVLVERRGLCRKAIYQIVCRVQREHRARELDEGEEIRAARGRLLEVFRAAVEEGSLGVAVRAQRELSRMLGLRRRMSDERMGGDLGERLANQLAEMTELTRVIGGAGDSDLAARVAPPTTAEGDDGEYEE